MVTKVTHVVSNTLNQHSPVRGAGRNHALHRSRSRVRTATGVSGTIARTTIRTHVPCRVCGVVSRVWARYTHTDDASLVCRVRSACAVSPASAGDCLRTPVSLGLRSFSVLGCRIADARAGSWMRCARHTNMLWRGASHCLGTAPTRATQRGASGYWYCARAGRSSDAVLLLFCIETRERLATPPGPAQLQDSWWLRGRHQIPYAFVSICPRMLSADSILVHCACFDGLGGYSIADVHVCATRIMHLHLQCGTCKVPKKL